MTDRVFNFSAGPAALPLPVLQKVRQDLLSLPGAGASILEISHRSKAFIEILEAAQADLKKLLSVPDNYKILFLQGGSRLQFSMVPMNLLRGTNQAADFLLTGSWSKKALIEAKREGSVNISWDGKETGYDRLPLSEEIKLNPQAAYVHTTSNETIEGVQFKTFPDTGDVPLVVDASSDFLCRPTPINQYGLLFACAQKNAGPAGVTVVIIREDLLERSDDGLPGYLNFQEHVKNNSLYNTAPTFGIYVVGLVVKWLLEEIGGLSEMESLNRKKSQMLYEVIDESKGFFRGHAQADSRSLMNVTFRLPSDELQSEFLTEAEGQQLSSLKGHRSVGGIRVSIYNAMPLAGVEKLRDFMRSFLSKHRN